MNPNFLKAGEIARESIIKIKGERKAKRLGLLTKEGKLIFDVATGINAEVVEAFFEQPEVVEALSKVNLKKGEIYAPRFVMEKECVDENFPRFPTKEQYTETIEKGMPMGKLGQV